MVAITKAKTTKATKATKAKKTTTKKKAATKTTKAKTKVVSKKKTATRSKKVVSESKKKSELVAGSSMDEVELANGLVKNVEVGTAGDEKQIELEVDTVELSVNADSNDIIPQSAQGELFPASGAEEGESEVSKKQASKKQASEKQASEKQASERHSVRASKGPSRSRLVLELSNSLQNKLTQKAKLEGVSVHDLASELLAEGLVLRAWEIMERKSTLRASAGGGQNQSQQGGRHNNKQRFNNSFRKNSQGGNRQRSGNSNGNSSGKSNGNVRGRNYKNVMDDSASFLEYVRNQEKRQSK